MKWWNNPGIYIYKWVGFVIPINLKQADVCLNIFHSLKKQEKTSFGHWQMSLWGYYRFLFHRNRQKNSRNEPSGLLCLLGMRQVLRFRNRNSGLLMKFPFFQEPVAMEMNPPIQQQIGFTRVSGIQITCLGRKKSWRLFSPTCWGDKP